MENIAVVELILETLGKPHDLISYVADRLGQTGATRSIQRRSSPSSAGSRCIRRARGFGRRSSGILTIELGGSRCWPSGGSRGMRGGDLATSEERVVFRKVVRTTLVLVRGFPRR